MSTVIRVENLCKRYYLSHKERERFPTLRDAVVRTASNFGKRLLHPLRASSGRPMEGLNSTEEFWALEDVSFEVKQGERIGIIGSNGAGKSTLLKILSRITEPTAGRVSLKGRTASLLEVGTGFHPELTGRENVFLNGAILGMSRVDIRQRFDEIVDFAEIEKFLDTPVKRYSSGMYVRLAFAIAAHLEPEILIVDEVLAVGDAQFQKKCLGKMGEVSSEDGRTVLFVSHNMGAVSRLCSRAVLLNSGRKVKEGKVNDVVPEYLHSGGNPNSQYVQPSDPTLPMCLLGAELVKSDGSSDNTFSRNEPVAIRIRYQVNKAISSAHVYSVIFDAQGTYVLGTGDCDVDQNLLVKTRKPGVYQCEYKIPAYTLNQGTYSVSISLGIPYQENFQEPDNVLVFNIVDVQKNQTYTHRKRDGVIWLDIPWDYSGPDPF